MRRSVLLVGGLLLAAGWLPQPIGGQSVLVTVVQVVTREPVPGAIASLLGADGGRLASLLTDERGQATLESQTGRRVRVLVESIGFATSRSAEFELLPGIKEIEVALAARQLVLPTVAVRDRRRCEAGPTSAASVALWEEVRKALTATTLTAPRGPQLAVWRYVRRLDRSHRIIAETTSTRNVAGIPFATASARDLSSRGFTREQDGTPFYFAPDAELLLSPSFVQTYCFGVRGDEGEKRLVGLTFAPQAGRSTTDIAGTLWLDAKSSELRWMEFTYTGQPRAVNDAQPGGRVEFERFPNGAWVVQRWHIRLPVMARAPASEVGRLRTPAGDTVVGFREEGGWLTRAALNAGPTSEASELTGFVFDSLRGTPVANVRIVLGGGAAEARTDQEGRYRLRHHMPGRYAIRAEHPRLAAFGSGPSERETILTIGRTTTVSWTVAGASVIRDRLCPSRSNEMTRHRAIIAHVVDSSTGSPIVGASTSASWKAARLESVGRAVVSATDDSVADTRTDGNGFATFCVGQTVLQLTLRAEDVGRQVARAISVSDTAAVAEVLLPLSATPGFELRFTGRVVARSAPDSSLAAEILIPGLGRSYHTDKEGRFEIAGLGSGALSLIIRSPGYQPLFTRTVIPQSDSVPVFALDRLPQALQTVTVVGVRDFRGFEERRAVQAGGTYISRDDLAARESSRLSDVLRSVPGVRIQRRPDGSLVLVSARGILSRGVRDCFYQIILDGQRIFALKSSWAAAPPSIDDFAPNGLEGIEVYTGPATTPPQFGGLGAACGTIILWTRRQ